ncbi:hypothetical protein FB472_0013 [Rhodoglobus vestalii]|uniref:Uncharacterized protein n=1 Tax=Rhodoglobus vestalii TaxID=193384 RepID=A0A8H2PSU0_9MICO|nr:hypothetical protein [Rhodoglobus vestalii]TQO18501.1 hypothetical protein FB472_0013 [Rhodoglobus vestalii]
MAGCLEECIGEAGEATAFAMLEGVQGAISLGSQTTTWVRDDVASGVLPGAHPLTGRDAVDLTGSNVLGPVRTDGPWAPTIVNRGGLTTARIAEVFASLFDPVRIIISGAVPAALEAAPADVLHIAPGARQALRG